MSHPLRFNGLPKLPALLQCSARLLPDVRLRYKGFNTSVCASLLYLPRMVYYAAANKLPDHIGYDRTT